MNLFRVTVFMSEVQQTCSKNSKVGVLEEGQQIININMKRPLQKSHIQGLSSSDNLVIKQHFFSFLKKRHSIDKVKTSRCPKPWSTLFLIKIKFITELPSP